MEKAELLYTHLKENTPFAFLKLNDGEINGLKDPAATGISRGAERSSALMAQKLSAALNFRKNNYYIGIPCSRCQGSLHTEAINHISHQGDLMMSNVLSANILINSNLDKTINALKKSMKDKNIVIVTNAKNSANIRELEPLNIKPYKIIEVAEKYAFETDYERIKDAWKTLQDGDIVICLCGPLGRILCYEWYKANPQLTCLELGSMFDPLLQHRSYLYHTGNHQYCEECYPCQEAKECSLLALCSEKTLNKECCYFYSWEDNKNFYQHNYEKIKRNTEIRLEKEPGNTDLEEIIQKCEEKINGVEEKDYRNNNKSQLFTLAEQFYNQRNLVELDKVCDLYLDYFSTIESPQLHKILFYSSFANFDINREKAIQQGELLYDKKDVHKDTRFYTMCNLSLMYTRDPTPIPKIIHLLFFGETNFENYHYECISSMIKHMPDYEIIIHNKTEPVGNPLWDEITKKVTVEKIEVPEYFDGYKLNYFQYKADVVRLEVIYEKGGIYLDIDMLIIKNFEHLINTGKGLYISEEGKRGSGWINAFIAAKPKNEFLKLCLENFKMGFRMENWAWHMRDGNRILFEEHPHYEIKYNMEILEHKYFFPFSWTEREKFINIADHLNDDVHGIHLYETILHDVLWNNKYFLHTISEDVYYHDFENDRFVNEYITHSKKNGYFIELGGCDGINGSQCYYFEKNLNWDGLCVEPCAKYRKDLSEHRKKPIFKAVSDRNETTTFMESDCTALSGVKTNLLTSPNKDYQWYKYKEYDVELSTLIKLLDDQGAPTEIDFCGMDIENSELPVLAHFFKENKGKYKIKCFAIEANDADQLNQLMLENSYIELKNPYLDMKYVHYEREKRKITWEKYYLHTDYIDDLDDTTIIKNTDQISSKIYDKILVLTLEEQSERRLYMEKLLHDHRLERHSLLVHRQHKQPLLGCLEAHMNAIKYAKKHNLKSVMIFEDDIIINDSFKTIDTYPDNWDMLYFGGILTDHKLTEGDWIKGTIWCNHAYIVKAALYDKILEIYEDLDKEEMARKGQTSDWLYTTFINPHYNCWLYEKQAIIQKEGFSLLEQKQKWGNNFDWNTWVPKQL